MVRRGLRPLISTGAGAPRLLQAARKGGNLRRTISSATQTSRSAIMQWLHPTSRLTCHTKPEHALDDERGKAHSSSLTLDAAIRLEAGIGRDPIRWQWLAQT